MLDKARMSLLEAQALLGTDIRDPKTGKTACSGAANRAYYALYQAVTASLTSEQHKPGDYESGARRKIDPVADHGPEWPHWLVRWIVDHRPQDACLEAREAGTFFALHSLRVKADYKAAPVRPDELTQALIRDLKEVLTALGVNTDAS